MAEYFDTWPSGAIFMFHIQITNQATQGASNIELIYTAGAGNEFEVLYGMVENGDTVGRAANVFIDTGTSGEDLMQLARVTVTNGEDMPFPTSNALATNGSGSAGTRFIVAGPMRLRMQAESVADGQDFTFSGVLRLRGETPTRSTVGAGTETVTVDEERVV